jgi:DNA-binding transcriptional MocR family regulator
VILCGSLSKLIAPGLRIGFVAGGRWAESIKALQHATAIACATLPQAVLSEFMHSSYTAYLKKMRQVCQQSIAMARKIVSETFPKGTTTSAPQGGYLLWVILPAHCNAQKLLDAAMAQHGIAFAHGGLFSNLSAQQSSLRLNCALMAQSHEQEGLQKLGQIAQQMFGVKN